MLTFKEVIKLVEIEQTGFGEPYPDFKSLKDDYDVYEGYRKPFLYSLSAREESLPAVYCTQDKLNKVLKSIETTPGDEIEKKITLEAS